MIPDYYQSLIESGFRSWAEEERSEQRSPERIEAMRRVVQSKGYANLTDEEILSVKVAASKFEPEMDLNPGAKRERKAKAEMISFLERIFPRTH